MKFRRNRIHGAYQNGLMNAVFYALNASVPTVLPIVCLVHSILICYVIFQRRQSSHKGAVSFIDGWLKETARCSQDSAHGTNSGRRCNKTLSPEQCIICSSPENYLVELFLWVCPMQSSQNNEAIELPVTDDRVPLRRSGTLIFFSKIHRSTVALNEGIFWSRTIIRYIP